MCDLDSPTDEVEDEDTFEDVRVLCLVSASFSGSLSSCEILDELFLLLAFRFCSDIFNMQVFAETVSSIRVGSTFCLVRDSISSIA